MNYSFEMPCDRRVVYTRQYSVSFDNPSGLVDISNIDVVDAIQSAIENDWESGEATINGVTYSWRHDGDECDEDYLAGWGDVDPEDVTTGGTVERVGRIDCDKLATLQTEYAKNVALDSEEGPSKGVRSTTMLQDV